MKVAKMIFTILTILSVIAAAITALMFESGVITKFTDAGLIFYSICPFSHSLHGWSNNH